MEELGLIVKIIGDGEKIARQLPVEKTVLCEGNTVLLYTDSKDNENLNTTVTVPYLIGKPAAECNSLLQQAGLNIKVVGENLNYATTVAVKQSVAAGTQVEKGTLITIHFEEKKQ